MHLLTNMVDQSTCHFPIITSVKGSHGKGGTECTKVLRMYQTKVLILHSRIKVRKPVSLSAAFALLTSQVHHTHRSHLSPPMPCNYAGRVLACQVNRVLLDYSKIRRCIRLFSANCRRNGDERQRCANAVAAAACHV